MSYFKVKGLYFTERKDAEQYSQKYHKLFSRSYDVHSNKHPNDTLCNEIVDKWKNFVSCRMSSIVDIQVRSRLIYLGIGTVINKIKKAGPSPHKSFFGPDGKPYIDIGTNHVWHMWKILQALNQHLSVYHKKLQELDCTYLEGLYNDIAIIYDWHKAPEPETAPKATVVAPKAVAVPAVIEAPKYVAVPKVVKAPKPETAKVVAPKVAKPETAKVVEAPKPVEPKKVMPLKPGCYMYRSHFSCSRLVVNEDGSAELTTLDASNEDMVKKTFQTLKFEEIGSNYHHRYQFELEGWTEMPLCVYARNYRVSAPWKKVA